MRLFSEDAVFALVDALRSMARGLDKSWRSRDDVNSALQTLIDKGLVAWSYKKGIGAWRPTPAGEFCLLAYEEGRSTERGD